MTNYLSVWPDTGSGEYQEDGSPYWIVSRGDQDSDDTIASCDSLDEAVEYARRLANGRAVMVWDGEQYQQETEK